MAPLLCFSNIFRTVRPTELGYPSLERAVNFRSYKPYYYIVTLKIGVSVVEITVQCKIIGETVFGLFADTSF